MCTIWVVLLGMMNPKIIGSNIERRSGRNVLYNHQNGGEIYPGELRHSGLCNPIIIDLFEKRNERHGTRIHASGEASSEKNFALSFL